MFLTKDSKSPFFQLVYFLDGKRTKVSTKTSDREEAEKFKKFFAPHSVITPAKETSIKLTKFRKEYEEYISNTYSKAYLERAVVPSFNKLQEYIPDVNIETISSRNADQVISSVIKYSRSAASLYHRTLKAAFNKALTWNYIKDNPFSKVKPPKVVKSYPLFITHSEFQEILNHTHYDFLKDIFTVAFNTGLRIGELLNMKWNWIDFNQKIIAVKNSVGFTTKGKKERIIPMNQAVQSTLKNRLSTLNKNDFVFYKFSGVKLNENFVSKSFKKAVRAAKLDDNIHFHTLRHSFASALVQRGVSLYVVKDLLGHEDLRTSQIYSHLQKENLFQAVNLL